jgi:cysteine-rich repeat protein
MRRITGLMAGLILLAFTGNGLAQVDCSGGNCIETPYGLGVRDDYLRDEYPPERFRWLREDFGPDVGGQSYFFSAARPELSAALAAGSCGPEGAVGPLPGMVFLKEQSDCVPTSTGPECVGGANDGKLCHMNAGDSYGISVIECPDGTCVENPHGGSGCRVEIPLDTSDGGVTPTNHTSELKIFTSTYQSTVPFTNPPVLYNLTAQTGNTFGGTSAPTAANGQACPITNRRLKPSMATRYLLPEARRLALGRAPGATYLRWDSAQGLTNPTGCTADGVGGPLCQRALNGTNLRWHTDDTRLCCDPNVSGQCTTVLRQVSPEYPLLTNRTCLTATRPFVNDENIQNDWIFVGGQATAFYTDPQYTVPGQLVGVCQNNRDQQCFASNASSVCTGAGAPFACCTGPRVGTCNINALCTTGPPFPGPYTCCTGAGTGTCGDPCPGLSDTCDFTEPGHRIDTQCRADDGTSNTRRDCCKRAVYVLRGTPRTGCALLPRMQYDGDPGKDCSVSNYGIDHRWDRDCDGFADTDPDGAGPQADVDLCPFLTEWNQTADGDGDCGTPGTPGYPLPACRGDECECGDMVGAGVRPEGTPFAVGDGDPNVTDLVAINVAAFNEFDGTKRKLTADTNNDIDVNVSDLIGIHGEIFRPDSSLCRQLTPRQCGQYCIGGPTPAAPCTSTPQCGAGGVCTAVPSPCCGDGTQTAGEACDDGNFTAGDGCNSGCRIEPL